MQQHWLSRDAGDRLILFMLGWGCDELAVKHLVKPLAKRGFDTICFYDYRETEPVSVSMFDDYKQVYLVAWSFGVFMAEALWGDAVAEARSGSSRIFTQAIAVNGTPLTIDNQYGIPEKSFDLTLKNIKTSGIEKFQKRAMGEYFVESSSLCRPIDQLYDELFVLSDWAQSAHDQHVADGSFWDCAIVGSRDLIFPVQNMQRYWDMAGVECITADIPHFPFGHLKTVLDVIQDNTQLNRASL